MNSDMIVTIILSLMLSGVIFLFFFPGNKYEIPSKLNWLGASLLILITLPYQLLRLLFILCKIIVLFLFTKKEKKPKPKKEYEIWSTL